MYKSVALQLLIKKTIQRKKNVEPASTAKKAVWNLQESPNLGCWLLRHCLSRGVSIRQAVCSYQANWYPEYGREWEKGNFARGQDPRSAPASKHRSFQRGIQDQEGQVVYSNGLRRRRWLARTHQRQIQVEGENRRAIAVLGRGSRVELVHPDLPRTQARSW